MKSNCLFIFLFLASNLVAQTWQPQPNAPNFIGPFSKLDDIHFINTEIGWTINASGKVYKTANGGMNWSEQEDLGEFLRCVKFANENVGYIGSLMGSFGGPPNNARLFKTTDGGDTWMDLTDSISPAPIGICGLSVVDEQTVYGCGAYYAPARVYKSLDGGANWENIDLTGLATSVVDLHFFTADFGYVVGAGPGAGGVVLKTTDGGANWEIVHRTMIGSDLIWKIQALDEQNLFAAIAGVSMADGARILVSKDGGANWTSKLVAAGEVHLQGVGFITPDHGFAGGFFDGVYETKDGGDTWALANVGANYNRFQTINDTLMYASGHTIYEFTDSSDIMTSTSAEIVPSPNYALNSYPNPASELLKIDYRLGQATHLKLSLYDAKGQMVISFYDDWHPQGEFHMEQSLEGIPPGLYLLGFLSREGDIMNKVVIER